MNDVFFEERYALMRGRIQEIQKEEVVKEPYGEYFRKTADFILMVDNLYEKIQKGWRAPTYCHSLSIYLHHFNAK